MVLKLAPLWFSFIKRQAWCRELHEAAQVAGPQSHSITDGLPGGSATRARRECVFDRAPRVDFPRKHWFSCISCTIAQTGICLTLQSFFVVSAHTDWRRQWDRGLLPAPLLVRCGFDSRKNESKSVLFLGHISRFPTRPSHRLHPLHFFAREGCPRHCATFLWWMRG